MIAALAFVALLIELGVYAAAAVWLRHAAGVPLLASGLVAAFVFIALRLVLGPVLQPWLAPRDPDRTVQGVTPVLFVHGLYCNAGVWHSQLAHLRQAGAANLVPLTLEPGGKSPAIVSRSADLAVAARKVAHGRLFNAGQVCVAPDYALVPGERVAEFAAAVLKSFSAMVPEPAGNTHYTSIVTPRHVDRLQQLLADARSQGATVLAGAESQTGSRRIPLHVVTGVTDAMRIAREEIFGPILPLLPYDRIDDAIAYVAARPRPLALHYFGSDGEETDAISRRTHAGGITINDWGWHVFQHDLPFGGVGASGMGTYHGKEGFQALSHAKAMFATHHFSPVHLSYPPYGRFVQRLALRVFLGDGARPRDRGRAG